MTVQCSHDHMSHRVTGTADSSVMMQAMEGSLHPVIDSYQADGELFVGRCQPMRVDQLQNNIQISASKTYTEHLTKLPQTNNHTLRLSKTILCGTFTPITNMICCRKLNAKKQRSCIVILFCCLESVQHGP